MKQWPLTRLLDLFETAIQQIAMAVMVGCVLWGVLTRYITEQPAVWSPELSGIVFTWVVFIGAMSAFRRDLHIRVPLLVDILKPAPKRALTILADLLVFLFLCYTAYLSYWMMLQGATRPSPVMKIPFSYVYLAPLVAFIVMAIHSGLDLVRTMLGKPKATIPDSGDGQL